MSESTDISPPLLASDPPAPPVRASPKAYATTFRLLAGETPVGGIRRASLAQLETSIARLLRLGEGIEDVEAIHEARKSVKRVRALLRLVRSSLPAAAYREANVALRDAARQLAQARDQEAMVEAIDRLVHATESPVATVALARLRTLLAAELQVDALSLHGVGGGVTAALGELDHARALVTGWPTSGGFGAIAPGLARVYDEGRQRQRSAQRHAEGEALHEWRKSVKHLRHAAEILRSVSPEHLEPLAADARRLGDLLGEEHDLAVLAELVAARPNTLVYVYERQMFLTLVQAERDRLTEEALTLGRQIYGPPHARLVRRTRSDWRRRSVRVLDPFEVMPNSCA